MMLVAQVKHDYGHFSWIFWPCVQAYKHIHNLPLYILCGGENQCMTSPGANSFLHIGFLHFLPYMKYSI